MDIKRIREELCLYQREFAKLLGVSDQTVSDWECGRKRPSIANRRKIVELCKQNQISVK